jgi:hypothetical protein
VSTGLSVVSGGVVAVAGAMLLAAVLPQFRTFARSTTGEPPPEFA